MWEGAGLEGQVLVAVGFFTLQLEAFFSPRNAWLSFSYCFALIVLWMFWPAVKVPNCGALPYNLRQHESKQQIWGHLVGTWNCKLPIWQNGCSWCRTRMDKYQHPGWSLEKLLCERSAAEGIQYAAFPFWLQTHVSETCAIALLFMPPSDLPKADYRKLPVNLKMQRTSLGTSSSALKINPGVWGDKDISLVMPELLHEQVFVSTNIKPSPFTSTQRGGSRGPGLNWDEHLKLQHPARSQCGLQCICPKFYQRNVF